MTEAAKDRTSALRRRCTGQVVSRSGDKTISVVIQNLVKHPMYGKFVHRNTKVAVHDPRNEANVGDLVEIVPCRRLSKSKSWRMTQVVRQAKLTHTEK
jgi:small subunit ribosomal protein S17